MKTRILNIITAALLLSVGACESTVKKETVPVNPDTSTQSDKGAEIVFDEMEHNFGTIIQGEKVSYSFRFVNKGDTDLIVSTARGSCGCTVPTYPRCAIKPGEEGRIDVVFDSENLMGIMEKTITVLSNSNTQGLKTLKIHSNIILPEERK